MKKCPYCAEEIQDEAVICRYCWHELPQSIHPSRSVQTKRSVWVTGAKWAGVLTALEAIGAVIGLVIGHYYSTYALLGGAVILTIPSYIVWWLICTLVAWLWRKAGNRAIIKTVIISSIFLLGITFSAVIYFLMYSAQQRNSIAQIIPTVTSTIEPTPNPLGNCYSWDTITMSSVGQTVCIFGRVSEAAGTDILFSQNRSQIRIIYRAIGTYLTLRQGDCIYATDLITNENGILMMKTGKIDYCPPGFVP